MVDESTDRAAPPLKKPNISKVALAIGIATILWELIGVIRGVIRSVEDVEVRPMFPSLLFISVPWFVAGIALIVRSLRGAVCWPRAIATWAGGFLVGAPAIIIGTKLYGGLGDTTTLVLDFIFIVVCLVVGPLLLRIGFKR
jgi:hypothetical protein